MRLQAYLHHGQLARLTCPFRAKKELKENWIEALIEGWHADLKARLFIALLFPYCASHSGTAKGPAWHIGPSSGFLTVSNNFCGAYACLILFFSLQVSHLCWCHYPCISRHRDNSSFPFSLPHLHKNHSSFWLTGITFEHCHRHNTPLSIYSTKN